MEEFCKQTDIVCSLISAKKEHRKAFQKWLRLLDQVKLETRSLLNPDISFKIIEKEEIKKQINEDLHKV